jgi:predicted nuclease of predicted toxin-antitoxin system
MLRLLADENFHGTIFRGLLRRQPDLDLVRVQDVGLSGASDPNILAWAAQDGRLLLTHDLRSMPGHVADRLRAGATMPGVIIVPRSLTVGQAIDEVLTVALASQEGEWEGQVIVVPL